MNQKNKNVFCRMRKKHSTTMVKINNDTYKIRCPICGKTSKPISAFEALKFMMASRKEKLNRIIEKGGWNG